MRTAFFFINIIFVVNALRAQIDSTKVFESCRGKLPLPVKHFTKVIDNSKKEANYCMFQFDPSTAFISDKQDSVFSICEGSVRGIFETDSAKYAMIINFGEYFLCYYPIQSPLYKKGDYIKAKQFIGYNQKDYSETNKLTIQLYKKGMKELVVYNWFKWQQNPAHKAPQRTERTSVRRN